jgi:hypothetical protein
MVPHQPFTEDMNYILGSIHATVKTLPDRMDKFEMEMKATIAGLHTRLTEVEKTQAHIAGARNTLNWLIGIATACCSGLLTALFMRKVG